MIDAYVDSDNNNDGQDSITQEQFCPVKEGGDLSNEDAMDLPDEMDYDFP